MIPLFYPYVPASAVDAVSEVLKTRWIGQGPKVNEFESLFKSKFEPTHECAAVGSCTDALHLSYVLCDVKPGDEVVCPVFTCTATNIPLLYHGVNIRFADIQKDTLNIDPKHVAELVNENTKAIVCVHYGGLPCDMDELRETASRFNIPIIGDAAQAVGAAYGGMPIGALSDYTCYSFQAIKHITTADGGMLALPQERLAEVKRRRWFGIDREAKLNGIWANDIWEIGYKYQMTDVSAAMGIEAVKVFDDTLAHRQKLFNTYVSELEGVKNINIIGANKNRRVHAAWMMTITTSNRDAVKKKLYENGVESDQVHYRNDRYSVFGGRHGGLPNMDAMEEKYLVLPLHMQMNIEDVKHVCKVLRET